MSAATLTVDELMADPAFEEFCEQAQRAWLIKEAGGYGDEEVEEHRATALRARKRIPRLTNDLVQAAMRRRVERLRAMPYQEYLRTRHWQLVREIALDHALDMCRVCPSQDRLQVHHRTYESRGAELLADLTVLCAECHQLFHERRRLEQ